MRSDVTLHLVLLLCVFAFPSTETQAYRRFVSRRRPGQSFAAMKNSRLSFTVQTGVFTLSKYYFGIRVSIKSVSKDDSYFYLAFLFPLGVSLVVINCICLSFMQIHTDFYFDYIIYSGLLIFCCQNVATPLL